ncbi:MAG: type II toxin-antitoxin system VapC family toxin [Candidatus Bathyarchaeia archaeon]
MTSAPLRLYIDTNIYLDHFLRRRGRSSELFREIRNGTFEGITSHFTFSEMAGVLKVLGCPRTRIESILGRAQSFPNITIVFHDTDMFLNMPDQILNTCVKTRDVLHFAVANSLAVDRIVTRDEAFKNAVGDIIQGVNPEDVLP